MMFFPWILMLALVAAVSADSFITSQGPGGSVFISNGSINGDQYYAQWTIRDLTCYVAKDTVNGVPQIVKQCRKGLLGLFHPMTPEEEQIIQGQIIKNEHDKKVMNERMAQTNAMVQNTMRSMNNQLQNNLQNMNNYMNNMQQMMQRRMMSVFG